MLPKKKRLSRQSEIKATINQRQYQKRSPLLSLVARDNGLANSRVVIVTPKKLGKAVTRNRLRRVFQGGLLKIWHKIAKNIDIVVFPRHTAIGISSDEAATVLLRCLETQKLVIK
ncbi:MAG: ribonuclease P protein component [Candidatus Saganbacteria bacterium]|nr:ribonuclease P protein component [Candidatus Saganbacteria bacterium]